MKSKTGAISGSTNWALVQQKLKKKKEKKSDVFSAHSAKFIIVLHTLSNISPM